MKLKAAIHCFDTFSTYAEAVESANPYKVEWGKAIHTELDALKRNETWEDNSSSHEKRTDTYADLSPLSTRGYLLASLCKTGKSSSKLV